MRKLEFFIVLVVTLALTSNLGYAGDQSCFETSSTPGCGDDFCEDIVCGVYPECCEGTSWFPHCQDYAKLFCPAVITTTTIDGPEIITTTTLPEQEGPESTTSTIIPIPEIITTTTTTSTIPFPEILTTTTHPPSGACCYEGDSTCLVTSEWACNAGGIFYEYHGEGTTCDPNPCNPTTTTSTTSTSTTLEDEETTTTTFEEEDSTTTTNPVGESTTTTTLPFAGFPVGESTTTQTSTTTKSTSTTSLSTSTSTTPTQPPILDSDGDGWSDSQEISSGTDIDNKDTDGDGYWDPNDPNPLDPNIPEKLKETIEKQTGFMERIINLLERIFNGIFGRNDDTVFTTTTTTMSLALDSGPADTSIDNVINDTAGVVELT
jgi:hypothetical protein